MSSEQNNLKHTEEGIQSRVGGHWLVSLADLDDQQKYIASLRPDESYMVEGCAGSGKSVLAMIKFNQLCSDGRTPVYATRMRGLADTIISEMLQDNDEGMKIARDYIQANTVRVDVDRKGPSHGKPWFYRSSCVGTYDGLRCITPEPRGCPLHGDSLVLDECQDMSYQEFQKIIHDGGFKSICWYGDDDQQLCDNMGGEAQHVRMREIFEQCFKDGEGEKYYSLSSNYRISRNVAKFVDEFQNVLPDVRKKLSLYAKGRRTDKPYLCGFETGAQACERVVDVIMNRRWHVADGHTTAIFVGLPNNRVENAFGWFKGKFEKSGLPRVDIQRRHGETKKGADDWVTADPSASIIVSTPLQSKGCQFDAVFVLLNTFGDKPDDLNAIHVAMTRSGGDLFVFYAGSMPAAFDQIPMSFYRASLDDAEKEAGDLGLK